MTVEQALSAALESHGVAVRACRASFHDQAYFGASNRLRSVYVRRDYPSKGIYAPPPPYDISRRHPWPTKAQVEDPAWLAPFVETLLIELDAHKDQRETFRPTVSA